VKPPTCPGKIQRFLISVLKEIRGIVENKYLKIRILLKQLETSKRWD